MSLDVYLTETLPTTVFDLNITHNLSPMADAAGIYKHLWRPEEVPATRAEQLIEPLTEGLRRLREDPDRFKEYNPSNGWGDYDGLCGVVERYLAACKKHPDAEVRASR